MNKRLFLFLHQLEFSDGFDMARIVLYEDGSGHVEYLSEVTGKYEEIRDMEFNSQDAMNEMFDEYFREP